MTTAFELAPASERTLDAGAYLLGALELAVIAAALGLAAWSLRRMILPGWEGPPARLVEAVLAIAAAIWLAELFGTFGVFGDLTMISGSLATAAIAWTLRRRLAARRDPAAIRPSADRPHGAGAERGSSRIAIWLAAVAVAAATAAWMVPTLAALAGGMDRADSLWYHMPQAARFADGGELGAIDFFDPIFFASFYPANSEVLHAIPLLAFGRDILSPLLNLGFLALGLLASYCIGRPYGVGPQSLIGGAIALGAQQLVEFQAGEALNDIVGVAFVLAAVAILVNAAAESIAVVGPETTKPSSQPARSGLGMAALAVAGIAAGLAAGTKLSFLAPVTALFVGITLIAGRGTKARTGAVFAAAAFAGGGYWFVRNLIAVGNPIPYSSFGPLGLPAPERAFELREPFSVAHYWNDLDVWADWFVPGLNESFGVLWPLTLLAVLGTAVYALWRASEPLVRVLGGVVVLTVLAYLITPLTAAGEPGEPIAFEWNVRYMAPAVAIALALLPCLPLARAGERARHLTLAGLCLLAVATIASLVQWQQGHVKGAVTAGVAVIAGFALHRWLAAQGPGLRRRASVVLAAVVAVGALGAGWWEQNHYLERRYDNLSPQLRLAEAVRWARDLRDARVAVGGVRGVFNQYPFYGTDLSNHVQWLGEEGPDKAFLRIPTCSGWRQALADGDYTHVVTTYDPFRPGALTDTKEGLWTREDSAAEEIVSDGPVSVFELSGDPDPEACGDLPDLSEPELNGDSVNIEPTANQP